MGNLQTQNPGVKTAKGVFQIWEIFPHLQESPEQGAKGVPGLQEEVLSKFSELAQRH